ncbi:MAG: S9 family peptidase [Flavobacteriaceae bacterium]|nr:S9 family peptidase [Flavobacteriaceae bacterium]
MQQPPVAKQIPEKLEIHGDTRIDPYFWMRLSDAQKEAEEPDAQTQDVLDYLHAENKYLKQEMKPTEALQEKLYEEIVGRIKQDDSSVPVTVNGYTYYTRFEEGQDYPYHCRTKDEKQADEEVMLNGPKMAEGKSYFSIGGRSVSENNQYLAYGVDLVSRREYTLHIKDLTTGEILSDIIKNTTGSVTWANDNKTIFYVKKDPLTLRANQIYKHRLGTDVSEDELVFEETDETFSCWISKTKSRQFLMIGSSQTLSTEYRFLDADTPDGNWQIIHSRERNLEYFVDHYKNDFYIITNDKAKNFRLMKTSVTNPGKVNWREIIGHRNDVLLEDIEIFKEHLVVNERHDGLTRLRIIRWKDMSEHYVSFDDPTYAVWISANPEFNTSLLRFGYSSLTTPTAIYDYEVNTKEKTLKKQDEVLGGVFDRENYRSERIMAPSRDGKTQIPISIVYHKDFKKSGQEPLLLYGYGSYGNNIDPWFSSSRLSLLDRGFAFAIAHIRGGQEMGRSWYEDGKMLKKKNTFYDFIDAGSHLVDKGYTSRSHMYAQGGSAGGLLIGAVINMEPSLWNGAIAAVPFVDVISTMMDETIPLTTFEFDEWGNPKDKEYYDYMKSYSPYDNVAKMDYPNLLITTGYWDSQVQYWEPAKWIAKLRDNKTDDNLLLMDTNMEVGHGGASGRFKRYKEVALSYAFLLHLEK